ncbi:hypothetical protein TSAR_015286 [Trichomalopsis sarcophagae]|uniref:Uncharacterized protein n=1 Tax=Trichomalopsis sarcophagae TaxID=543379 RepID=A0A232EEF0_9HYME|nr:hypothetical protein TSAR_015286 [Trichomalopsis sarcophagae]
MGMGLNNNTPGYLWRREAGRHSLEIETRKRASKYLLHVLGMGKETRPRICLKEELREILNKNQSKWGGELERAMEEVGDQTLIKLMYECKNEEELAEIKDRLERGLRIKLEQEIQRDWEKIEKSNYCPDYKNWKEDLGKERYWENKEISGFVKEQWARMRCGNIGREKCKGFLDSKCRSCIEARKEIEEELKKEVDEKKSGEEGENMRELGKILKRKPNEKISIYAYQFEKTARERDNKRKENAGKRGRKG